MHTAYVIGSGPAGVSCAHALVEQGLDVTMLDAGLELEPDRQRALAKLQNSPRQCWDEASLGAIKANVSSNFGGIPKKLAYGSEFPYLETEKWMTMESHGVKITPSLAVGGLSNVWGAAVLPYSE